MNGRSISTYNHRSRQSQNQLKIRIQLNFLNFSFLNTYTQVNAHITFNFLEQNFRAPGHIFQLVPCSHIYHGFPLCGDCEAAPLGSLFPSPMPKESLCPKVDCFVPARERTDNMLIGVEGGEFGHLDKGVLFECSSEKLHLSQCHTLKILLCILS